MKSISPILIVQMEYLGRLALAALLGGLIGIEREFRRKEAGIRTHLIVCLASCLMMLVSKYGFGDMLGLESIGLDPSRVAAGIVTGVGFLGAGVIFTRGHAVNGLTTAAGVWATVGVGMAIGAGMYFVSVSATLLILAVQAALFRDRLPGRTRAPREVRVVLEDVPGALPGLLQAMETCGLTPMDLQVRRGGGELEAGFRFAPLPGRSDASRTAPLMEAPHVKSVEL